MKGKAIILALVANSCSYYINNPEPKVKFEVESLQGIIIRIDDKYDLQYRDYELSLHDFIIDVSLLNPQVEFEKEFRKRLDMPESLFKDEYGNEYYIKIYNYVERQSSDNQRLTYICQLWSFGKNRINEFGGGDDIAVRFDLAGRKEQQE